MNKHVTSLVLKFICYNKTIWKKQRKNFSEPETAIQKFPNARFYWKITLNRWRWLTYKYLTWWKHFSNFNTCMSWNYYELIKNSSFSRQTLIIIFKGKIIKDNMNTSTKEWHNLPGIPWDSSPWRSSISWTVLEPGAAQASSIYVKINHVFSSITVQEVVFSLSFLKNMKMHLAWSSFGA